jgi:hypothetical protein
MRSGAVALARHSMGIIRAIAEIDEPDVPLGEWFKDGDEFRYETGFWCARCVPELLSFPGGRNQAGFTVYVNSKLGKQDKWEDCGWYKDLNEAKGVAKHVLDLQNGKRSSHEKMEWK